MKIALYVLFGIQNATTSNKTLCVTPIENKNMSWITHLLIALKPNVAILLIKNGSWKTC